MGVWEIWSLAIKKVRYVCLKPDERDTKNKMQVLLGPDDWDTKNVRYECPGLGDWESKNVRHVYGTRQTGDKESKVYVRGTK